jgi:hypothetical protein
LANKVHPVADASYDLVFLDGDKETLLEILSTYDQKKVANQPTKIGNFLKIPMVGNFLKTF